MTYHRHQKHKTMDALPHVKKILRDTLSLGQRADSLTRNSILLGEMPEFDSMAVLSVVTALEDELGIRVEDDELSAEVFATVGSLADFVSRKVSAVQPQA